MILDLVDKSRRGRYAECLQVAAQMKQEGVRPDLATYNALLESASKSYTLQMDTWAIFEDMLASGVKPDVNTINFILKVEK
jgi:pentatricopeptide repeat protein